MVKKTHEIETLVLSPVTSLLLGNSRKPFPTYLQMHPVWIFVASIFIIFIELAAENFNLWLRLQSNIFASTVIKYVIHLTICTHRLIWKIMNCVSPWDILKYFCFLVCSVILVGKLKNMEIHMSNSFNNKYFKSQETQRRSNMIDISVIL